MADPNAQKTEDLSGVNGAASRPLGEGPRQASPDPERGPRDRSQTTRRAVATPRSSLRDRRFEAGWLAALVIVWTVLARLFPPNGDDWAWGSKIGIIRLEHHFAGYNGRYAANLVVLTLGRVPILAALAVGVTMAATIYLVLAITGNRTPWGYGAITALLLAMPHLLWGQAISWLSGFTNYGLSTLWVLVYLRSTQRDWQASERGSAVPARSAGTVAFAFVASLFMENVTIFFVLASIAVIVTQRVRFARVSRSAWCWASGFLLGAVAMFSNSAYRRASTGGQGYQQMSGLSGAWETFSGPLSRFAVVENIALNVAIVGLVALLGVPPLLRNHRGKVPALAAIASAGVFIIITVPLAMAYWSKDPSTPWLKLGAAAMILLLACLVTVAVWLIKSAAQRMLLLCLMLSAVVLLGPLLIVSPIGPRCFYVVYVLMLAIVSVLLREVSTGISTLLVPGIGAVGVLATVGLFTSLFVVYIPMSSAADARLSYIRHQVADGATEVVVDRLPSAAYTHLPDPTAGRWAHRYKLYYGLPNDLILKLAPRR